jgi:hypothetical protein
MTEAKAGHAPEVIYSFSYGINMVTEVQVTTTLEQKLDRLLNALDEIKPIVDRWRASEAAASKQPLSNLDKGRTV